MIEFSIYTIFTLFVASACSILEGNWFQIVVLTYLLILFFYKQRHFDNAIFLFFAFWISINLLAYTLNRSEDFEILSFFSLSSRMLFPYLMIKIIGDKFFDGLFNFWFVLCLLGFPFFVVESIDPQFVQSLAPKLNFMTQTEQTEKGGFYLFFYMHSGWAVFMGAFVRNCGFMWEPGAYSLILVFMIVYRLFCNNMKIDLKVIFLVICILTTFSTSAYLALFAILFIFLYKNQDLYKRYKAIMPIISLFLIIGGYAFYSSAEFMSEKIDQYAELGTKSWNWSYKDQHVVRVSRWGYAIMAVENSLRDPWGDGIINSDYVIDKYHNARGPNSLATILFQWGWLGVFVLYYSLYRFKIHGRKCGLMLALPLSFPLFSNPFAFRTLVYAIVFSVVCIPEMRNMEEESEPEQES